MFYEESFQTSTVSTPDLGLQRPRLQTPQVVQQVEVLENKKNALKHDWRPFVFGGLASCIAECGTFPLDTTKTRLQIQGQRSDARFAELRYRGMFHALFKISGEEGVRALYSGLGSAVLRQSTYGTIKFGIYYSLKDLIFPGAVDENLIANICCGILAGSVSSAIANPTDVLKVRMQACSRSHKHISLIECFSRIYREEGVRGLWKGVCPTAQRAAVITGVELPVYDGTKRYLINHGLTADTTTNHLISGAISSLAGAVASTPIDVIRVRLMNQKLKLNATTRIVLYKGSVDCLLRTVKTEGFRALYKGFVPTFLRMGPWNLIFFVTYEQLKKSS
ncbi:kidney mitochondrial carrier protein 1-like [Artemia franciscana]|uniref:Uncharacterized protein n=1 Tax=Artemia franciscana TaxID=6661 RepID=A0AA88I1U0_ARTSF|nr:hypothetical protein QYM36_005075 [Artemia franciscana]KAK2719463.1 hypothetical protein QYM36_005075 [Artemia franciscana]